MTERERVREKERKKERKKKRKKERKKKREWETEREKDFDPIPLSCQMKIKDLYSNPKWEIFILKNDLNSFHLHFKMSNYASKWIQLKFKSCNK